MDRNRVRGTVDEVVGVTKKKTGEMTGDTKLEIEGAAQQVKGKLENVVGKAKDGIRDANEKSRAGYEHRV